MRYRRFTVIVTALFLSLSGCDHKSTSASETETSNGLKSRAPSSTVAAREDQALVRFINADPAGKPRELWSIDTLLFSNVRYKAVTPYVETPSKVLQFRVREMDGPDDLIRDREELFAGRHYTLIGIPKKDGTSFLLKISDDLEQPKSGAAKVRLINATVGVDNLDLYRAGSSRKIEKSVNADSATSFTQVDPGTFTVHPAKQPVAPRLAKLPVEANRLYTLVVVGKTNDLDVIRIEDKLNGESARD
jgi:hypothetical protein